MSDSAPVTLKHIARVGELLDMMATELSRRGVVHDASKFDPIEKGPLDEMQRLVDKEGPAPYGTEEYRRRTALLGPMLEHHYAHNSHHPEHYGSRGIAGMDLFDLIEMWADWKAASERGAESAMNLSYSIEKHGIPPMLADVLRNTADRLGWAVK
ncbi:DUF5662 family protein [Mesorhizobium sp.]|uniref:DUF5662 family protein n=1 Tax=Mesorhizobium sp. TaxID=1871066 RepID=UPI0011FA5BBD|nr:DUF5662 family protein [Mesorhizobium sp.]TIX28798.1 MAG: hypothetical protein E5V35_00110 [Mesorhizobium sp.]